MRTIRAMAARRARSRAEPRSYWAARIGSREFARGLTELLRGELRALAERRIGDLVDREQGRRIIRHLHAHVLDRVALADLALAVNRRLGRRVARRRDSLLDLIDPELVAEVESLLDEAARLTPRAEQIIGTLMGEDFMHALFTDLIYSALMSFYRRADPLFGGLGMRMLEPQIKTFIRAFMPMVQQRATAFVIRPDNQRIAAALARAALRQALAVPLGSWAELGRAGPRQQALLRRAARDVELGARLQDAALAVWDELYAAIAARRLGDLIRLDAEAPWFAQRGIEAVMPLLLRPAVLAFIGAEATAAARDAASDGGAAGAAAPARAAARRVKPRRVRPAPRPPRRAAKSR